MMGIGYGTGYGNGYGGMMGGGYEGFWWMGLIGMLLHLVVFVGVIYFIFHLIRSFTHQHHSNHKRSLEILEERYAKGEITEEEFKKMKHTLTE